MTMAAKKRKPSDGNKESRKRYISRDKVSTIGIPKEMYEALKQYAQSRSDEFDEKSTSWAARVAIGEFLKELGLWPPNNNKSE